ncbi:MAG: hypothetical protein ACHP7F_02550, partial [Actinomycetales bacterium]
GGQQSSGTGGSGAGGSVSTGNGHTAGATHAITDDAKNALAQIAASTLAAHAHEHAEPAAASAEPSTAPVEGATGTDGTIHGKHVAEAEAVANAASEAAAEAEPAAASPAVDDAPKKSRKKGGARTDTPSEPEVPTAEPVTLLDIPVVAAPVKRRPKAKDAEQLLDSVLDSLPQPKQPGQGRGRSRRVSTAAIAGGSVAPQITRTESEE